MNKEKLLKVVVPLISVGWIIMLCMYGWWILLWTVVGMAIGVIVKQLKENVQNGYSRNNKSTKEY